MVLSLQLPFAVDAAGDDDRVEGKDGRRSSAPRWLTAFAGVVAAVIVALNVKLVVDFVTG